TWANTSPPARPWWASAATFTTRPPLPRATPPRWCARSCRRARPPMADFDIVGLGEALIEFNQTLRGEPQYLQGYGGDTSNAVIAAARQGARCAYLTRVGGDACGEQNLQLWRTEGVDTSGVRVDEQAHTGVYFVQHGADGHVFSYLRRDSAASRMQPADLDSGLLERTRYLHVSGISLAISASACDTAFAAIERTRGAGGQLSLDSNLRLRLW